MSNYKGPATIVYPTGLELHINATLNVEGEPADIGDGITVPVRSWNGEGRIPEMQIPAEFWDGRAGDALGDAVLRLPDGGEAPVVVASVHGQADMVRLDIAGRGRPPFGDWS